MRQDLILQLDGGAGNHVLDPTTISNQKTERRLRDVRKIGPESRPVFLGRDFQGVIDSAVEFAPALSRRAARLLVRRDGRPRISIHPPALAEYDRLPSWTEMNEFQGLDDFEARRIAAPR
jgi:hypothetical protein